MQNDSNVNPILAESEFLNLCGLKKAKDVIRNAPEDAKYWVLTTGYHNDIPDFSQYKFQHLHSLSKLKNVIDEYELTYGVDFGIPEYLQCEPRTYTLKSNSKFDDIIEFKINILIKCTDDHISQVFNSLFGNDSFPLASRYLKRDKNNKLACFLKIIAWFASNFYVDQIDKWIDLERLQNFVLKQMALQDFSDCFEIKAVGLEWFLNDDHFEIVTVEG